MFKKFKDPKSRDAADTTNIIIIDDDDSHGRGGHGHGSPTPPDPLLRVYRKLDKITHLVEKVLLKEAFMSVALDALAAQVKETTDAELAAITLIHGLADQLNAIKDDPVKIAALVAELKATEDALGAAVVENTPAEPPPVEEPPVA